MRKKSVIFGVIGVTCGLLSTGTNIYTSIKNSKLSKENKELNKKIRDINNDVSHMDEYISIISRSIDSMVCTIEDEKTNKIKNKFNAAILLNDFNAFKNKFKELKTLVK